MYDFRRDFKGNLLLSQCGDLCEGLQELSAVHVVLQERAISRSW